MAIGTDAAHLLGVMIGLTMYGFYMAVFVATLWRITRHQASSKVVRGVLIVMNLLTTAYYCLSIYDNYMAFIAKRDNPGTIAMLDPYTRLTAVFEDTLYMIDFLLADCLLTWRLFVVWPENKWALRVACCLLLGLTITGFIVLQFEVRQYQAGYGKFQGTFYHWAILATGFTISNNVLLTSCIGGRLWWMGRQIAPASPGAKTLYQRITFVLVQSGFIYLVCMAIQITIYGLNLETAVPTYLYIAPSVVALFPTAIILQLTNEPAKEPAPAPRETDGSIGVWARPSPTTSNALTTGNVTAPAERPRPTTSTASAKSSAIAPSGSIAPTTRPAVSFMGDIGAQRTTIRRKV